MISLQTGFFMIGLFFVQECSLSILDDHIEQLALVEGYGYKYANLSVLQDVCRETKSDKYHFKIPEFVGVSSHVVQKLINQHAGWSVEQKWGEIVAKHFPTKFSQTAIFTKKTMPDDFLKDAASFRVLLETELKTVLPKLLQNSHDFESFVTNHRNERLMVRSTGKEDSKQLANAGGNESVANVPCDLASIYDAMITVIRSYFEPKSILQRLRAKDASLLEAKQLTPVVIQVMAGSRDPKFVSKCGVMFTEETQMASSLPEGSPRTGITIIQSAYGHNEAVVLGLIPVDTYYVDDEMIYPIIRKKYNRLVPGDIAGHLESVPNHSSIVQKSSLSPEAVLDMKRLANSLEIKYGYALDVEFVVTEDPKEILIVQARPVVKKEGLGRPSYLDPSKISEYEKFNGTTILQGGSNVKVCTANKTIVAKRITEAYKLWSNATEQVECIILGDMAPETSHEATIFRSEGIATVQFEDYLDLEKALKTSVILLSPQQAQAILLTDTSKVAYLTKMGWFTYPAPLQISLLDEFLIGSTAETAMSDLKNVYDCYQKVPTEIQIMSLADLESIITQSGDRTMVRSASCTIIYKISRSIQRNLEKIPQYQLEDSLRIREYQRIVRALLHYSKVLGSEIDEPHHLLHSHFVRSILRQLYNCEIVSGHSASHFLVADLAPYLILLEEFRSLIPSFKHLDTIELLAFHQLAYTENVRRNYKNFIVSLDSFPQYDPFAKILFEGSQLRMVRPLIIRTVLWMSKLHGMIPLWLQLTFKSLVSSPLPIVQQIVESSEHIKDISIFWNRVHALNPASFAGNKTFDTQLINLQSSLVEPLTDGRLKIIFNGKNQFLKIYTVFVLSEFVEKFDLAIKALKLAEDMPSDDGLLVLRREQMMLKLFYILLESWLNLSKHREDIAESETMPKLFEQIHKNVISKNDFFFSSGFNVASAVLSSKSIRNRTSEIETLEDAYSTLHQNLEYQLGVLSLESGASEIELPEIMQTTMQRFKLDQTPSKVIGISIGTREIKIRSNRTLRNHGLQRMLMFNRRHPNICKLSYWFGGLNQSQRWSKIAAYLIALRESTDYDIEDLEFDSNNGIGFSINITEEMTEEKLNWLQATLDGIIDYTNDHREGNIYDVVRAASEFDLGDGRFNYPQILKKIMELTKDCYALGIHQPKLSTFLQKASLLYPVEMCDLMLLYLGQNIWTRLYFPFGIADHMFFSVVVQNPELADIVLSRRLELLDSPMAKDHAAELVNVVLSQSDLLKFKPVFAKLSELASMIPDSSVLLHLSDRIRQTNQNLQNIEPIDCNSLF